MEGGTWPRSSSCQAPGSAERYGTKPRAIGGGGPPGHRGHPSRARRRGDGPGRRDRPRDARLPRRRPARGARTPRRGAGRPLVRRRRRHRSRHACRAAGPAPRIPGRRDSACRDVDVRPDGTRRRQWADGGCGRGREPGPAARAGAGRARHVLWQARARGRAIRPLPRQRRSAPDRDVPRTLAWRSIPEPIQCRARTSTARRTVPFASWPTLRAGRSRFSRPGTGRCSQCRSRPRKPSETEASLGAQGDGGAVDASRASRCALHLARFGQRSA